MKPATVTQWLQFWEHPQQHASLCAIYGVGAALLQERAALAMRTLQAFAERFGDCPVRLFRAPGRINLRGMHVDIHGGYLNLMTHQREVLLAVTPTGTTETILANTNPDFSEITFNFSDEYRGMDTKGDWWNIIADPEIAIRPRQRRTSAKTAWSNYCIGAALRVAHGHRRQSLGGLKIMVGSDLPHGAAISSSAALIIASLMAYERCNALDSSTDLRIKAAQDIEWYAGSRVGMSDQTAVLMGRSGHLLHLAVFAKDFSLENARHISFPDALDLLVVNSYTRRALSGAQRLEYVRNRFAYSMALTVMQEELKYLGWTKQKAAAMDRLSRITADSIGGMGALYRLLKRIPESIDINLLRQRYNPPGFAEEYNRYFGDIEERLRPRRIPLRGPLLFGIAESERARIFPDVLENRNFDLAGKLMSIGHDGDRVRDRHGNPFSPDISDSTIENLAAKESPVALQPGAYSASSPALDMLVDAAQDAGALGACLTGAGIAGAVLVLCRKENTDYIRQALATTLQQESYSRCAGLANRLDATDALSAVAVNHPTAGACEITLDD